MMANGLAHSWSRTVLPPKCALYVRLVLLRLALDYDAVRPWPTLEELARATGQPLADVEAALAQLRREHIVVEQDSACGMCAEPVGPILAMSPRPRTCSACMHGGER
jgi:hypothetical protein